MDCDIIGLLHRANQRGGEAWAAAKSPGGVTPTQYFILRAVASNPGCSQTDIVEATGIDRSTMADTVKRMCAKGLLKRERGKLAGGDERAYSVSLCSKGSAALDAAEMTSGRANAVLTSHLSKSQVQALSEALGAVCSGVSSDRKRKVDRAA